MDKRQPRYNFGLLETPDCGVGEVRVAAFSTSSSNASGGKRSAPTGPLLKDIASRYGGGGGSSSGMFMTPAGLSSRGRPDSDRSSVLPGSVASACLSSAPSSARLLQTPSSVGAGSVSSRSTRCRSTPGSTRSVASRTPLNSSTATTPQDAPSLVVALLEGRGALKYESGLACIDLKRPVLILSQFTDDQAYAKIIAKLHVLRPLEILMPNTAVEGPSKTRLYSLIQETFPRANISTVSRNYYDNEKGIRVVKELVLPEYNSVEMAVKSKFLCLSACAALIKYVEFIQSVSFAPSSLKIVFKGVEQTTRIDMSTVSNLELLENSNDDRSHHSLYGMLHNNAIKTRMGARLLRSNILQPPNNVDVISMRQDVVQELTEREDIMYTIHNVLARFVDTDHLLARCVQVPRHGDSMQEAENTIANIIMLKHTVELVAPLSEALRDCNNPLFRGYAQFLEDDRFGEIIELISEVIQEDTKYQKGMLNMRTQKCFAVKPNINGMLDITRRTYTEIIDDIADEVKRVSEEHDLPVKMAYNGSRGFHMSLAASCNKVSEDTMPEEFLKVTKSKNLYSFTSTELIGYNDRIKAALNDIFNLTNIVVKEVLRNVLEKFGCMYQLTEVVAVIDMLAAFAFNSTLTDSVRPEFTDTLAIKQGKHPILERILPQSPVPNNVYASDESNFVVLTGPNMSGKSTYLRQIAMLQILAQMGMFVPAEYASFRMADQIFSRIGSDDDPKSNSSSFALEMKEMNFILQNATGQSLIIIDELGRGTSADEGVGICFALCEYLLNLKAFTFLATHFQEITTLDSLYPNVENYHFEVKHVIEDSKGYSKITYTHVLAKGRTSEKQYGLKLAEMSTMPTDVVENAKSIAKDIIETKQANQSVSSEAREKRAVFKLAQRLVQTARSSTLNEDRLRDYLTSLKHQYHRDLQGETQASGGGAREEE